MDTRVTTTCPICGKASGPRESNPSFPFCSERCQLIDLGRWLDGDYRIPGRPVNEDDNEWDEAND